MVLRCLCSEIKNITIESIDWNIISICSAHYVFWVKYGRTLIDIWFLKRVIWQTIPNIKPFRHHEIVGQILISKESPTSNSEVLIAVNTITVPNRLWSDNSRIIQWKCTMGLNVLRYCASQYRYVIYILYVIYVITIGRFQSTWKPLTGLRISMIYNILCLTYIMLRQQCIKLFIDYLGMINYENNI